MGMTAQFPTISTKGVIGIILEELEKSLANSWVSLVANQYSSNQQTETYAGVGNVAPMREWIGEKNLKSLNPASFTISNKDFESTLRLFTKDLDRDKTSQLRARAGELATRAAEHEESLLSALIDTGDDGDIGLSFDGQYFFDTDHVFASSGTINNDITYDVTTTTAPTPTEAAAAMLAAAQAIYGFKDDVGEPINGSVKNFTVMVPLPFWAAFEQAASVPFLANAISNPVVNMGVKFKVVVNPRLTWTTAFAVFVGDKAAKPFIVQTELGPMVETLAEGSDYAFFNAAHLFSVIKRGNVGYSRFDQACLVTLV